MCLTILPGCDARWSPGEDEGFRLYVTWQISQGEIPYRDFFDNQMPNYHLLIAPFLKLGHLGVDGLRKINWFFGFLIAFLWVYLADRHGDHLLTAIVAVGLLCLSRDFLRTVVEFRPDLPSLAVGLTAVIFIFHPYRSPLNSSLNIRLLSVSGGILLGFALFMKPTPGYFVPGLFILSLFSVMRGRLSCEPLLLWLSGCLIALLGQFLFWEAVSGNFWQYVLATHQVPVVGRNTITSVLRGWSLEHWLLLSGLCLHLAVDPSTMTRNLFWIGLAGLVTFILIHPNTPYRRHLLFLTIIWSYPAGSGVVQGIRSTGDTSNILKWLLIVALAFGSIFTGMNLRSPLTWNPAPYNTALWIREHTQPQDEVLTDYGGLNFMARRKRPPGLTNVSANLTATGIVSRHKLRQALRRSDLSMFLFHLGPNAWHLANIPGIEGVLVDVFNSWTYHGIRREGERFFLVFTPSDRAIEGIDVEPNEPSKIVHDYLKKYSWNRLADRLTKHNRH